MAYAQGSYQQGLLDKGYVDNGDGSFTSPSGQRITPLLSDTKSAAMNDVAGRAAQFAQGDHSTDPQYDPRYGLLDYEHQQDPTDYALPDGTKLDQAGNIIDKPPGFWEKYGPWLALAGAGGAIAIPAIAAAAGGAGAAGGSAATVADATGALAPVAGGVGAGVPASVLGAATPVALSGPATGVITGGLLPATAGGSSGGILNAAGQFTGTTGKILGVAGKIGNALGGLESGRAAGRVDQTALNQRQDQLAQQQYQNELDATKLNLTAPGTRMGTSVRGDILADAQPFRYGAPTMVGNIPVPTSSGGLSPALFSPSTRALGSLVSGQQLAAQEQNNGNAIASPPPLTPMPTAGTGDSILNAAATLGNLSDLFSPIPYVRKKPTTGGANG